MSDITDATSSKRKQPEQEVNETGSLKKTKTLDSESLVDSKNTEEDDTEDVLADEDDEDDNDEEEQEDDEDDDEEEDEEDEEDEGDGNDQNLVQEKRSTKGSSSKAESSTQAGKSKDMEGSDHDDDAGISDGELEALDTSLIMNTGRRTRGKKIDYTQFGADTPADEE